MKKSTPVTLAQRREIALLRVLKKRFNRMQAMYAQQTKGWSIARIARRHRLTPTEVRTHLRENDLFGAEVSLCQRIHHQETPGTLIPGDKAKYRAYCRSIRFYSDDGREYQGPAAEATFGDPGLRILARIVYTCSSREWDKL